MQAIDTDAKQLKRARLRRLKPALPACVGLAFAAIAHGATPDNRAGTPGLLAIQVNADKLTLAVAKVPQIYLYGTIDAGAPDRFEALVRSGKVPPGSDVYLNSPGGDLQAGIALGRLFRAQSIATHLGVPRKPSRSTTPASKVAVCMDACTLAYLGGLFRWSPTGNDRFGALPLRTPGNATQAPDEADAYLKELNLTAEAQYGRKIQADASVMTGDEMINSGLANNGRLAPTVSYHMMGNAPLLTLGQSARDGQYRITLLCKPDGLTVTAYYMVGVERARKLVSRANRSYFEIDNQQTLPGDRDAFSATSESVMISRPVPLAQVTQFLSARSVGAWLADRGGAVRYGFTIYLESVRNRLQGYGEACAQMAKASTAAKR
ncbi:hypothetical protein [Dyella sp. EPa41]|uniref:hypothetical protein n=1 Tax=Dyella sp. EPa41 TaxID=1561194 RepID=UPI001915CDA9|nr:hypothetical protein [Dyella sp. EPa41]